MDGSVTQIMLILATKQSTSNTKYIYLICTRSKFFFEVWEKKDLFWIAFLLDTAQVVWIGQSTISLGRCLEFITGTKRQPSETHS